MTKHMIRGMKAMESGRKKVTRRQYYAERRHLGNTEQSDTRTTAGKDQDNRAKTPTEQNIQSYVFSE